MGQRASGCNTRQRYRWCFLPVVVLLAGMPVTSSADALALSMEGPKTAREGELIEYRLKVTNEGESAVNGVEVLVEPSRRTDFVAATSLPIGSYDDLTRTWSMPRLGTLSNERSVNLTLQLLVQPALLTDPDDVVPLINKARVLTPGSSNDEKTEIKTHVVCGFCNDWEMVSVYVQGETDLDNDDYEIEIRFVFDILIANNGPVRSSATVTPTHFNISGVNAQLKPELPVEVRLDAGDSQLVKFHTTWVELESDQKLSWAFEVNDLSLHDPIDSNAVSGTRVDDIDSGSSSSGCTLKPSSRMDPLWLFMVWLPIMRFLARRLARDHEFIDRVSPGKGCKTVNPAETCIRVNE